MAGRAEGNAFYAEELLAVADQTAGVLPPTLREILTERLTVLPPAAIRHALLQEAVHHDLHRPVVRRR